MVAQIVEHVDDVGRIWVWVMWMPFVDYFYYLIILHTSMVVG